MQIHDHINKWIKIKLKFAQQTNFTTDNEQLKSLHRMNDETAAYQTTSTTK